MATEAEDPPEIWLFSSMHKHHKLYLMQQLGYINQWQSWDMVVVKGAKSTSVAIAAPALQNYR